MMTNWDKVIFTLVSVCLWTSFSEFLKRNLQVKLSRPKFHDYRNRIVSITHGILAFWLSLLTLLFRPDLLEYSPLDAASRSRTR